MALRREYALGHSSFNDFLFASIVEEENGQQLTVLSALARLGLNPWAEAARLSELSKDAAARALAAIIVRLPDDNWKKVDLRPIADRLVAYLPDGEPTSPISPLGTWRNARRMPTPDTRKWMFWLALAALVVFLIVRQYGN